MLSKQERRVFQGCPFLGGAEGKMKTNVSTRATNSSHYRGLLRSISFRAKKKQLLLLQPLLPLLLLLLLKSLYWCCHCCCRCCYRCYCCCYCCCYYCHCCCCCCCCCCIVTFNATTAATAAATAVVVAAAVAASAAMLLILISLLLMPLLLPLMMMTQPFQFAGFSVTKTNILGAWENCLVPFFTLTCLANQLSCFKGLWNEHMLLDDLSCPPRQISIHYNSPD